MEEGNKQVPEVVSIRKGFHKPFMNRGRMPKNNKKILAYTLLAVTLVGIVFTGLDYLRPAYVIGGTKITIDDINDHAAAIDEYKKNNKDLDFGGNAKQVARDDLVQNAAFKVEAVKHKNTSADAAVSLLKKKKFPGSARVQKMLRIRSENNAYQKALAANILSRKKLLVANSYFDAPFYQDKSKEQVQKLYDQIIERLNTKIMPPMKDGQSSQKIAKLVDVNLTDTDTSDDENSEQYFTKQVVGLDNRDYLSGVTKLNELSETVYNGVTINDMKTFDSMVDTLRIPGDVTPVFASKTGAFTILRLESASGGEFASWQDFIASYKKNNAKRIIFATEINPAKVISMVGDQVALKLTNPGLQKAYAAPKYCSTHAVQFIVRSYDTTSYAQLPVNSTVVGQSRDSHNCGSAYEGYRTTNNVFGALNDNCYGPAPSWSVASYADPSKYNFASYKSTENGFSAYPGWPKWSSGKINEVGQIYIDFLYTLKPGGGGPGDPGGGPGDSSTREGALDHPEPTAASGGIGAGVCNKIDGWVYADEFGAAALDIHVYFNAEAGQPGSIGWNIGPANKYRPDVEQVFPGRGEYHGFSFDPSIAPPPGLNVYDGNPHKIFLYGISPKGNFLFAKGELPACSPPSPSVGYASPTADIVLKPNEEQPTTAEISTSVTMTGAAFDVFVTRRVYVIKNSTPSVQEDIDAADLSPSPTSNPTGSSINATSSFGGIMTIADPISTLGIGVGDQICVETKIDKREVSISYLGVVTAVGTPVPAVSCKFIVNRPYIAVYGSDVFAGGGYTDGCKEANGIKAYSNAGYYGSGVQFAAYALGAIESFNTARLRAGAAEDPKPPIGLTFSNSEATKGDLGINKYCQYDYYRHRDDDVKAKPLASESDLPDGKWMKNGSVTLQTTDPSNTIKIANGHRVSLYVDGDVTINSNIEYTSGDSTKWTNPLNVSSFYLIVRGNIYIAPGVTRLDGVFIAQPGDMPAVPVATDFSGVIYTCASTGTGRRFATADLFNSCNSPLTINGNFQAHHIFLDRVGTKSLRDANSDEEKATTSGAAEVFNSTPEIFLAYPEIPRLEETGGSSIESVQILAPIL